MLWTWFLARANHVKLPPAVIIAMGLAVWVLYASDRLLDSRVPASSALIEASKQELEARHHFHRKHQGGFRFGILGASALLALLLPQLAPQSISLYMVLGTLLVGYFVLIHARSAAQAKVHRLPKELAVGVFFSAASFIPTVARAPGLSIMLLPSAVLFAVLCSLNCLFIYAWEHPLSSRQPHATTRAALRFLPHLALMSILTGLTFTTLKHSPPWPIPVACSLAACFLLVLHRSRHRFSPTRLRASADLCLLTPIFFIALLRH